MNKHFRELDKGMVNMLVPPTIQAELTGVARVQQDRTGAITLVYVDNTRETRPCKLDLFRDFSGLVGAIDYVQSGR